VRELIGEVLRVAELKEGWIRAVKESRIGR